MVDFISGNKSILLIFILWFFVGWSSIPVFFGIGGLTLILLWRKKHYFELLLGFLFILILSDSLQSATDFAKEFKNVYIVFLTLVVIVDRREFHGFNTIYTYFLPFIAVSLIGLSMSPILNTGMQKTLSYILLFFIIPQLFQKSLMDRGPQMVRDIIFFGILLILVGYCLRFVDFGLAFSHHGRFRAVFGNPNGLGIFTTLLFGFAAISREYFKGLFSKSDLRWIFIPLLVAIILSGSRTAIISVGLFILLVRFFRTTPFGGFLVFLVIGFGIELISSNLVQIVESLGLSQFFRVRTLEDGSGRYIAWNFAWQSLQSHFWFGRGFGFDEYLMSKNQDFLNSLGHQGGVHNTYLIMWLNTGLVGLLLYLRAIFLVFIKASKNVRLAFPFLWMVLFSIMMEPWLAASLNPYTILLLFSLTMMTDPRFQPYIRGELSSFKKPDEQKTILV